MLQVQTSPGGSPDGLGEGTELACSSKYCPTYSNKWETTVNISCDCAESKDKGFNKAVLSTHSRIYPYVASEQTDDVLAPL